MPRWLAHHLAILLSNCAPKLPTIKLKHLIGQLPWNLLHQVRKVLTTEALMIQDSLPLADPYFPP